MSPVFYQQRRGIQWHLKVTSLGINFKGLQFSAMQLKKYSSGFYYEQGIMLNIVWNSRMNEVGWEDTVKRNEKISKLHKNWIDLRRKKKKIYIKEKTTGESLCKRTRINIPYEPLSLVILWWAAVMLRVTKKERSQREGGPTADVRAPGTMEVSQVGREAREHFRVKMVDWTHMSNFAPSWNTPKNSQ